MSLSQTVLNVGLAVVGVVLLIRGLRIWNEGRSGRPSGDPLPALAMGLFVLLLEVSVVADELLHSPAVTRALLGVGLLVVLVPILVRKRQRRL
jgi:hypothetical protein